MIQLVCYSTHLDGEEEGLYTHMIGDHWYIYTRRPCVEGIDLDSASTPWWFVQQAQQAHDGRRGTKL